LRGGPQWKDVHELSARGKSRGNQAHDARDARLEIHWNTPLSLHELAERYNPILRGWLNYYGSFYKSAMRRVFDYFNQKLSLWARRKYQTLRGRRLRSLYWLGRIARKQPRLFVHWLVFGGPAARAMGAV
jgi:hypothetical protein